MIGQLDWDGVIFPMAEVTWESLLATAKRYDGLEVTADFYVTYKDEEGDLINVKNEVDLNEAIRWAEEQQVPTLCLHVPFASTDSDSDESWTEVDNSASSPRGPVATSIASPLQRPLDLNNEEEEEEDAPEEHVEQEEPEQQIQEAEERLSEAASQHQEEQVEEVQEEPKQVEEQPEEQVQEEPKEIQEEPEQVQEEPEQVEEVQEEPKQEQEMPVMDDEDEMEDQVSAKMLRSPGSRITTERIVEILLRTSSTGATDEQDATFLVDFFSDAESVREFSELLRKPAVQAALVAVARAEKAHPGSALKAATSELIKLFFKFPDVVEVMNRVPDLEHVLPRALAQLKPAPVVAAAKDTAPKARHDKVRCDGCDVDADRLRESAALGLRSEAGHVLGVRYKSATVPDYDLCEACEASGAFQDKGPFLKIVDPATAPELILCALPGAAQGMMNQVDSLDWRNPLAKEFLDFVRSRQQRAFPMQQREEAPVAAAPQPPKPALNLRCKDALKTFNTPRNHFTCDLCSKVQPAGALMHGCRACNFDVCDSCQAVHRLPLLLTPVAAAFVPPPQPFLVTPAVAHPPQAKFVSDVTLADGCVVRPGEVLHKTWRVRNSGAERWPAGTRIAHVGGDSFGGPLSGVEVPLAAPGEAVNVTVPLVMPQQPGRYTSYWRMMTPHPASAKFGHRFWVMVNVVPQQVPNVSAGVVIRPPPQVMLPGSPAVVARPPPPPPPPAPAVVQEEPVVRPEHEMAVCQITDLGFTDIDKIVKILGEVNGDTAAAIDRLLMETGAEEQ